MKKLLYVLAIFVMMVGIVGCNHKEDFIPYNGEIGAESMNLEIGNHTFNVTLENNSTVAALLDILPLDITMKELNGNEKYFYLNKSLPTNTISPGQIEAGDVMLYGNDCLVVFYKTFFTIYSYTKIGHISDISNLEEALGQNSVNVKWSV